MPHSLDSPPTKQKQRGKANQQTLPCHSNYLSVKSSVGDALDAWVVQGPVGDGLVLGGSRGTGGGGGLLAGSTQKETLAPLFQSSSNEAGVFPSVSEQTDLDFPVVGKSSSSKVTHPLGLLVFTVLWLCTSKLSSKPSAELDGLLVS